MVTSNFSLFLSSLLMRVFIFSWRLALVPHSSASSPAGIEDLGWLEGAEGAFASGSLLQERSVAGQRLLFTSRGWWLLGVRSGYPAASRSFMGELSESATVGEALITSTGWRQVSYFLAPSKGSGKCELRPTTRVMCRKAQCSIALWAGIRQGQNENRSPGFHQEHYKWWGKLTGSYLSVTQIKLPLKSEPG